MSAGAWDVTDLVDLVLAVLFAGGFFYFYVVGVHFQDRALSRAAGLAFLLCGAIAVWMVVRIVR